MAGNTPLEAAAEWAGIFGFIGACCVAWLFMSAERRALFMKDGAINVRAFGKALWSTFGKAAIAFIAFFAMIVGGLVGKALVGSSPSRSSQASLDRQIEEGFRRSSQEQNRNLPMMVDENTRLDTTVAGPGPRLTYLYTFPNHSSQDLSTQLDKAQLEQFVRNGVCTNTDMRPSLQYGATYVYTYRSSEGIEVARFSFNRQDCGLPASR